MFTAILLIICCGQLMVTTVNSVEAKELEEQLIRQEGSINAGDCEHFDGVIFEDKCLYMSRENELETWQKAKDACSTKNGELARFSDNHKSALEFIEARATGKVKYWVGGSDVSKEGDWEWDNGVSISLDSNAFPWGGGEPNGLGEENCLDVLRFGSDLGYNDDRCSYEQKYICEIGCLFNGVIYPPGTFIGKTCAQLQCDGTTGKFRNFGYDLQCQTCTAWGDPHIITYDSTYYETSRTGTCSLSRLQFYSEPTVEVNGDFVSCGSNHDVSCLGDLFFRNDKDTVLTCSFDVTSFKIKIQVNGGDVDVGALTSLPSLVKVGDTDYPFLAWTSSYSIKVAGQPHPQSCVSLQGSSGILVQFCGDHGDSYANSVNIWATPEITSGLKGFCGTKANGNHDEVCVSNKFDPKEVADASTLSRITTKCETNSSLPDIYQSQCEDAVLNGVFTAHTNLSQFLIDACVFDLCHVSNPEQWLGSVHAAMPRHHEIKEKTVGHCEHKRTHKCRTHNGTCILKTEVCDGTIIDRGCHGKKCICCAPNPCKQDSSCLKKQGKCILRKDWASCDGSVNSELCSGPDCACCYPKSPNSCKKRKKCSKVNGECLLKMNWENCDGKLKIGWCKGRKCACCYPK